MARSSTTQPLDLERLPYLSADELRELWALHMGRAKMPMQKRLLIRELAWRTQERQHGGLDAETRRLLNAVVRAASSTPAPATNIDGVSPSAASEVPTRTRRTHGDVSTSIAKAHELPDSTRLTRTWPPHNGVVHEVHILDGGRLFRYRDKTYKSLSEIARVITGTHWSGPRFFKIATRGANADSANPATRAKRRRSNGGASS